MRQSLQLFNLFNIPVKIHFSFLGLFLFLAIMLPSFLPIYAILFPSILLHEFGHALTARQFGIRCSAIYMHMFGGLAVIGETRSLKEDWIVSIAGPLVSFALSALFFTLGKHTGIETFSLIAAVNGVIGVFNMIPAFPMDGGRIARALLQYILGEEEGTTVAVYLSYVICTMGLTVAVMFNYPALAVLSVLVGYTAYTETKGELSW